MCNIVCTIGIPAYNEQNTVISLLYDIFYELSSSADIWQVIVVANGCTDKTIDNLINFADMYADFKHEFYSSDMHCLTYYKGGHKFQICEFSEKRKSVALNIIQQYASSEYIILLDADIRLSIGVLSAMYYTLKNNIDCSVVATRYYGYNKLFSWKNGWMDGVRFLVCHTINRFDAVLPRLDGKACGYHKSLIKYHPNIIPVDTWLEGMAWLKGKGCKYLMKYKIIYHFPSTFEELVQQYARYAITLQSFKHEYPEMYRCVIEGRSLKQEKKSCRIFWFDRLIGWVFFQYVLVYSLFYDVGVNQTEETWTVIETSK